jgi:hypothetical protein
MSSKPFNPVAVLSVLSVLTTALARFAWYAEPVPAAPDNETVIAAEAPKVRGVRRRKGTVADDCVFLVDLREYAWG